MNAPLPEHIRKALETVTLDDKYSLDYGRAFMSGVQALVKLPMLQRLRDAQQGKNTAGFISGYRGSPLGGYDQALWKAGKFLKAQNIVFQPGVNEELAATAIWGTQQLGFTQPETHKFDGVFGIWYGKGPGVDRTSDVFKHANLAGTTPWGGVIAVAGDDHVAKSSTAAHQSDHIFKACGLPVFFPASVQEILDLGIHAFAMSRFSGVWAGMKTIQEIVESSATAMIDPDRVEIRIPTDFQMPPGGVHIRWPDTALEQEARLFDYKWYAALAYIRANRLAYQQLRKHPGLGIPNRFFERISLDRYISSLVSAFIHNRRILAVPYNVNLTDNRGSDHSLVKVLIEVTANAVAHSRDRAEDVRGRSDHNRRNASRARGESIEAEVDAVLRRDDR